MATPELKMGQIFCKLDPNKCNFCTNIVKQNATLPGEPKPIVIAAGQCSHPEVAPTSIYPPCPNSDKIDVK